MNPKDKKVVIDDVVLGPIIKYIKRASKVGRK